MNRKSTAHSQKRKHSSEGSEGFLSILLSSLFGVAIGYAALLAIIAVISVICLFLKNPHPMLLPISMLAIAASFVISGFAALIKNNRFSPYLSAIVTGLIFMLSLKLIAILLRIPIGADSSVFYKIFGYITPIFTLPSAVWASAPKKPKHKSFRKR